MTNAELIAKINGFIKEKNDEIQKENSNLCSMVNNGQRLASEERERLDYLYGRSQLLGEILQFIQNELLNK